MGCYLIIRIPEHHRKVIDIESEVSNSGQDRVAGFGCLGHDLLDIFPVHLRVEKYELTWDMIKDAVNENLSFKILQLPNNNNKIYLIRDCRSDHHERFVDQVRIHLDEFTFPPVFQLILLQLGKS